MSLFDKFWKSIKNFLFPKSTPTVVTVRRPARGRYRNRYNSRGRGPGFGREGNRNGGGRPGNFPRKNRYSERRPSSTADQRKTSSSQGNSEIKSDSSPRPSVDAARSRPARDIFVGKITHYFPKIGVVVLEVKGAPIRLGHKIKIVGANTRFTQTVESLQIESVDVREAIKGKLVGMKVA